MKRKIALGWILVLLSLFSTITYAQDGGTLTTVTQGVRLRSGPGTEWKLLDSLEAGASFLIDGRAPGGGWVRGIASDGKIGWIVDTAVGLNADQLNALPSVWVDTPFTLAAPGGGAPPVPAQPDQPADAGQPASAPAIPPPEGGLIVTTGNTVKMRSLPSTDGAVILTLTAGTQFSAVGRDANQEWVRSVLGNGTAGWVSVRFVTITAEQLVSLPVTDAAGSAAAAPPAPSADPAQPTALAAVPIEPLVNTAPVKGFSYGGHVDGFGDAAVQRMHQAGMTWAKRQWRYRVGQNPADVAGMINDAHAKGFRILIGIVGFVDEVNSGGYFDHYAAFVGGVAA
ncbi:MAG: SH3 domain-containing protein, partial [Anaerolineae bacterium]|nr:SH3 domain-containing protein [Anaerolineae bacterium]